MTDLDVRRFNDNGDRVIVLAHGELGRDHFFFVVVVGEVCESRM